MAILDFVKKAAKSAVSIPVAATGMAVGAVTGALGIQRPVSAPRRQVSGGVSKQAQRAQTLSRPAPLARPATIAEMEAKWADVSRNATEALIQKVDPSRAHEALRYAAHGRALATNKSPGSMEQWVDTTAATLEALAEQSQELHAHLIAEGARNAVAARTPFDLVGNMKAELSKLGLWPSGSALTDLSRNFFAWGDATFKPFEAVIAPLAWLRGARFVQASSSDAPWMEHLTGPQRELMHHESLYYTEVYAGDAALTLTFSIPAHATHFSVLVDAEQTSPVYYRARFSRAECGIAAGDVDVKVIIGGVNEIGNTVEVTIGTKKFKTRRGPNPLIPIEVMSIVQFGLTPDIRSVIGLAASAATFAAKNPWFSIASPIASAAVDKLAKLTNNAPAFRALSTGAVKVTR